MEGDNLCPHISTVKRIRFTEEEDNMLKELVRNKRNKTWKEIAACLPGRTACQCRDRYNQYLFKEVVNKPWTPEEDKAIVDLYKQYGPHWVKISKFLPGRSGNNIKNRWNTALTSFHGIAFNNSKQERRSKKEKWPQNEQIEQKNMPELPPPSPVLLNTYIPVYQPISNLGMNLYYPYATLYKPINC